MPLVRNQYASASIKTRGTAIEEQYASHHHCRRAGAFVFLGTDLQSDRSVLGNDPYWILLHEPAVIEELKLSTDQRRAYQALTDKLDLRFFPLRNKSRDEALAQLAQILSEARQQLKTLLNAKQYERIEQILFWKLGAAALIHEDIAAQMNYSDEKREQIQKILTETESSVAELQKELNEGKPKESLQKKFTELKTQEHDKLKELLTPAQVATWKRVLGQPFTFVETWQTDDQSSRAYRQRKVD